MVDPAQAAHWWGAAWFTLTTHSKSLSVGGQWRYTMHGPDGTDYPNIATYFEIEEHHKLVYDHGATDDTPALFRVTVLFTAIGKNLMEMTMALATAEAAAQPVSSLNKLAVNQPGIALPNTLPNKQRNKHRFVINRSFDTSIETMYDVWTKAEHFSKWLPPTGFTMEFMRADLHEGGSSFYKMSNGSNVTMYGRAFYLEMKRPDRLVYTQQFCDEHENISRHPMAPTWPETMQTTVEFTAEGENRTRVTVTWEAVGDVKDDELQAFIKERRGMTMGWTGSFDKLEPLWPIKGMMRPTSIK